MKKSILILFVFLSALSINAQEPVIKIYMNDGSSKQYKINDIADLSFIRTNLSYSMTVFQSKLNTKSDFDIKTIDSIEFVQNQTMNIIQSGNKKSFIISEIDSIIFTENKGFETVAIGTQVWTLKNLDVSTYRNGDLIPQVTDSAQWVKLTTGAWCYYNNDPANGAVYGKLYNWYAVNDPRGLTPAGWHVPSNAEWAALTSYLGGDIVAGGKMKEIGTTHWKSPNYGATNSSGFTALPGGGLNLGGHFDGLKIYGYFWSATEVNGTDAWLSYVHESNTFMASVNYNKVFGISVRCIKD